MESSSNGQRHVGTSTANKMERKALLRQLALQEASRRSSSAGATAEGSSEVELGSDEDQKALLELLEEERQRNDNEWKIVREELAKLRYPAVVQSQPEDVSGPSSASRREMKRLQLAKLDFDIASLEEDLQTVPEARTTSTHEVRVRAILADAIAQLEEALHLLRMDVEEETKARIQQRKMLEDLKGVAVGLQLRKERIEAKAKNMDVDIIVSQLETKVKEAKTALKHLLRAVTASSEYALPNDAGKQTSMDFRLLVDALMNTAWSQPNNPYVNVTDYSPAVVQFLLRANVAIENPRDARLVALVAFAKRVAA